MKRIKELLKSKKESAPTYGQPLEVLLARDQVAWLARYRSKNSLQPATLTVPLVVYEMTQYLMLGDNIRMEGILRLSGSLKTIQDIRQAYDTCGSVDLVKSAYDVHAVAGALKLFLRDIPNGLVPYATYEALVAANENVPYIHYITSTQLPSVNFQVLSAIMNLVVCIHTHINDTKMSWQNLATVLGPNLFGSPPSPSPSLTFSLSRSPSSLKKEDPVSFIESSTNQNQLCYIFMTNYHLIFQTPPPTLSSLHLPETTLGNQNESTDKDRKRRHSLPFRFPTVAAIRGMQQSMVDELKKITRRFSHDSNTSDVRVRKESTLSPKEMLEKIQERKSNEDLPLRSEVPPKDMMIDQVIGSRSEDTPPSDVNASTLERQEQDETLLDSHRKSFSAHKDMLSRTGIMRLSNNGLNESQDSTKKNVRFSNENLIHTLSDHEGETETDVDSHDMERDDTLAPVTEHDEHENAYVNYDTLGDEDDIVYQEGSNGIKSPPVVELPPTPMRSTGGDDLEDLIESVISDRKIVDHFQQVARNLDDRLSQIREIDQLLSCPASPNPSWSYASQMNYEAGTVFPDSAYESTPSSPNKSFKQSSPCSNNGISNATPAASVYTSSTAEEKEGTDSLSRSSSRNILNLRVSTTNSNVDEPNGTPVAPPRLSKKSIRSSNSSEIFPKIPEVPDVPSIDCRLLGISEYESLKNNVVNLSSRLKEVHDALTRFDLNSGDASVLRAKERFKEAMEKFKAVKAYLQSRKQGQQASSNPSADVLHQIEKRMNQRKYVRNMGREEVEVEKKIVKKDIVVLKDILKNSNDANVRELLQILHEWYTEAKDYLENADYQVQTGHEEYGFLMQEKKELQRELQAFQQEFRAKYGRPVQTAHDRLPIAEKYLRYQTLKQRLQEFAQ